MANRITNDRVNEDDTFKMSNGLTSVFIAVLALAGSDIAASDDEREFVLWFASQDQDIVGRGTVGFDINDIPWKPEQFDQQKRFLLATIDRAKSQETWDRLGYQPNPESLISSLDNFTRLVTGFEQRHIAPHLRNSRLAVEPPVGTIQVLLRRLDPQLGRESTYFRCPVHRVYLHRHGCVICNDVVDVE